MANILVIGSSNTDMVVKTARFPDPGETIIGGEFFMFPGGKGANQAVAAARMGGRTTFICKVGDDLFGQQAIAGFLKDGIITTYCYTDPASASGVALITVNADGENEIVVAPGANALLHPNDIENATAAMVEADLVLIQLEISLETVAFAVQKAAALGKKVILNPAPAQTLPDSIFPNIHLITPNETEAAILTGIEMDSDESLADIAACLLDKGVQQVLITLGARGAYFQDRKRQFWVSAPKVEPIDTTAAGDTFNGALAVAIAEGMDLESAIDLACRAAAISVTRMGAQSSVPNRSEVDLS